MRCHVETWLAKHNLRHALHYEHWTDGDTEGFILPLPAVPAGTDITTILHEADSSGYKVSTEGQNLLFQRRPKRTTPWTDQSRMWLSLAASVMMTVAFPLYHLATSSTNSTKLS